MLESYSQLYQKALLEFGIDKDKYNLSFKYYDSEEDLLDIGTEICYSDFLQYYKKNGNKLIISIFTKEKEEKIIMSDAEEKEEGKITLKYKGKQKKVEMLEDYAQLYKKALEFGIDKDKYALSFKYY